MKYVVTSRWIYRKIKSPEHDFLPYTRLCVPTHKDYKPSWFLLAPAPENREGEEILGSTNDATEVPAIIGNKAARKAELEAFCQLENIEVPNVERDQPSRKAKAASPKRARSKA